MWPFTPKSPVRLVEDDGTRPRDEMTSRMDRCEADIADLYDRLRRLTGRLSKREERDETPARPTIAALRAQGRDPFHGR